MKKTNQPQIIINQNLNLPLTFNQDLKKGLSRLKTDIPEIKIVYFGTPEFSAYILEQLIKFCDSQPQLALSHPRGVAPQPPRFTIQAVVTRADKPVGRHQTISESPVALVARKYNLPTLKPTKLNEEFIKNHLSFLQSDLFVVVSYGKIIPQVLLDMPSLGAINVHGSILPKYRGASPIQTVILNGDKTTGITIMLMDAQMDHGPILSTKDISISGQDTYPILSTKMAQQSAPLLIDTLVDFVQGQLIPKEQNHSRATYCNLLKKNSGYFDINSPPSPEVLDKMTRAYYPWPGVWTRWNNKIIKFYLSSSYPKRNGRSKFLIQMEGKKPISSKDFLNGYPDFPIKFMI